MERRLYMISVILATYNESENIKEMIERVHHYLDPIGEQAEIIVVDDDSPDKTWEIAQSLGDPTVRVIRRTKTRGLASAILRGIIESRGDVICWWDADMLMCPEIATKMVPLLKDYDIVIGSRYTDGGGDARPLLRVLPSVAINTLAEIILGYNIKDYDSGFAVIRRNVIDTVLPTSEGYGEYFIEFMYLAARRGLKIYEYPYVLTDRERGTSKSIPDVTSFIITGFKYLLRIFIALTREG